MLATKPCRMPRLASPRTRTAMRSSRRLAVPDTSSAVSSPASRTSASRMMLPVEREAKRRRVAQPVVEEPHVEAVDGGVDQQVIDVGQLADDADAAARDRGGVGRQPRLEGADVGVERRVGDAERDVGVASRASARCGPCPDTARRDDAASSFSVTTSSMTPISPPHLADAFVAREEVPHGAFHARSAASSKLPLPPAEKSSSPDSGNQLFRARRHGSRSGCRARRD